MANNKIIDSKYTKSFISNDIDLVKYNKIKNIATDLLMYKNDVSKIVHDNLLFYMNMSKFDFITHFTNYYKSINININSQFEQELFIDVYTMYRNRQDVILNNVKFKRPKRTESYKSENNYSTSFLSAVNYMVKMIDENKSLEDNLTFLTYKISNFKKPTDVQTTVIHYFNKFGFRLVKQLYNRKLYCINKRNHLIKFSNLTFRGHSQRKVFINYNKHFGSKINAFATIVLSRGEQIDIPIKFNKDYHGRICDYRQVKKSIKYEYVLQVLDNKTIKINYVIDGYRDTYNPPINKDKTIGIDVNCKNNLLALSNNTTIDYDRKYYNQFAVCQKHVDDLKSNIEDYKLGKKTLKRQKAIKKRQVDMVTRIVVDCCKNLYSSGYETISMEDLKNTFAKTKLLVDDIKINQNRKNSFLGLSSVKNIFIRVAPNYGLSVKLVNPNYTSQKCSKCGCIDKKNRKNQEEFECTKCGYKNNADTNAAINIKNRLTVLDGLFIATTKINDDSFKTNHHVNSIS